MATNGVNPTCSTGFVVGRISPLYTPTWEGIAEGRCAGGGGDSREFVEEIWWSGFLED
jgi:hypothetical protein